MKLKSIFVFILFASLTFTSDFYLVKSISTKADFFTTDNLGNFNLITGDVVDKYDKDGKLIKTYSNKSLGKIHSLDAGNPMKIVLFYKETAQIIFLDNNLSLISSASSSLEKIGFGNASLVCGSYNDNVWIYDASKHEIKRFGFSEHNDLNIVYSGDINQMINIKLNPNFIIENNNRIFLNNPETGILVFDIFGTYNKTIPIKNLNNFQPTEDKIYYVKNKYLKTYDIKTMAEDSILLPDTSAISARIEKNRMYLQTPEAIKIFEIK